MDTQTVNKKVLITAVNAKYIHSNLAVYSLKAYAEKKGVDVDIELGEYTINQQLEDILSDIYIRKPDMLCFSCYIWNIEYVKNLIDEFHKLCPRVPIWVGGPEVSFCVEAFLKANPGVTGVIMGEGEETFSKLVECYGKYCAHNEKIKSTDEDMTDSNGNKSFKYELEKLSGIAFRTDNGVRVNPLVELLDMDELPFCYNDIKQFENRIIYYESSRGCPFSCSYCLSSIDKKLRLRSLPLVYKELQFFLDNRVPQVKFVDRTFNCNHEHAMGIWTYIYEHDNGYTNFHFEISADLLREDELELIAKMRQGLAQFEIGVQSTKLETIKEIKRTMNIDVLRDRVKKVQLGGNVHQHLDLIAGLPYEGYEDFKKSFDEIYDMKPEQLQLGFLKVLKGSYMYDMAKEYGLIYTTKPPYEVMATKWLSYDEMLKIKLVEEMLEIHYNSGQFRRALTILERAYQSSFDMYYQMARYYIENGLNGRNYSRLVRTEIFRDFACSVDAKNKVLYEQTLTYDLYIRECAKKRPSWSIEQEMSKDKIYELLRAAGFDKKYSHTELFTYPVWEISITNSPKNRIEIQEYSEPRIAVFNYDEKNIWTNTAYVEILDFNDALC